MQASDAMQYERQTSVGVRVTYQPEHNYLPKFTRINALPLNRLGL